MTKMYVTGDECHDVHGEVIIKDVVKLTKWNGVRRL